MSDTDGSRTVRLSRRTRLTAATVGGGLLALLVVAGLLKPDPRGLGTHEQLGLPGCTFLVLFGIRCPACGMTTAWSSTMHGDLRTALHASFGGTILAGVALAVGCGALAMAASGRKLLWPREGVIAGTAVVLTAIVVTEWVLRLMTE